jgi:hypothetical protein
MAATGGELLPNFLKGFFALLTTGGGFSRPRAVGLGRPKRERPSTRTKPSARQQQ